MRFFNKKEDVIDLKLTQHGHYLLSKGTFKPVYYSFIDDNVIYDVGYTGQDAAENQKDTHKRITEESVYLKTQTVFDSVEDEMKDLVEKAKATVNMEALSKGATHLEKMFNVETIPRRNEILKNQIGKSSHNSIYAPAWDVKTLVSHITSSVDYLSSSYGYSDIPQLNIDAIYKKRVSRIDDPEVKERFNIKEYSDEKYYLMGGRTDTFQDRTIIEIFEENPILEILEHNSDMLLRNYDIEVFRVEEVSGSGVGDMRDKEKQVLKPLNFIRKKREIVNNLLVDDDKDYDPNLVEVTPENVEYWFDITFDHKIDREALCSSIDKFNSKGYFVDRPIDCEEYTRRQFMDIYDMTEGDLEECE